MLIPILDHNCSTNDTIYFLDNDVCSSTQRHCSKTAEPRDRPLLFYSKNRTERACPSIHSTLWGFRGFLASLDHSTANMLVNCCRPALLIHQWSFWSHMHQLKDKDQRQKVSFGWIRLRRTEKTGCCYPESFLHLYCCPTGQRRDQSGLSWQQNRLRGQKRSHLRFQETHEWRKTEGEGEGDTLCKERNSKKSSRIAVAIPEISVLHWYRKTFGKILLLFSLLYLDLATFFPFNGISRVYPCLLTNGSPLWRINSKKNWINMQRLWFVDWYVGTQRDRKNWCTAPTKLRSVPLWKHPVHEIFFYNRW